MQAVLESHTRCQLPLLSPPFQADPEHLRTRTIFFFISFSVSLFYPMYICIYPLKYSQLQGILFLEISDTLGGTRNMIEAVQEAFSDGEQIGETT